MNDVDNDRTNAGLKPVGNDQQCMIELFIALYAFFFNLFFFERVSLQSCHLLCAFAWKECLANYNYTNCVN